MKLRAVVICTLLCLISRVHPSSSAQEKNKEPENGGSVGIQIKNVNLLLSSDMILGISTLRGRLKRTKPDVPVTFDDSGSFIVEVDSAEIHLTAASLRALMNEYVFGFKGAPIKDVDVRLEGGRLIQTGTIHKGLDLPFKIAASLLVTDDGKVRVHAEKIDAGRLPVKGLLHFLGEDLEKLIQENPGRGVQVEGDDLILAPAALTPPPHIYGRVARVSVVNQSVVLIFDSGHHPSPLKPPFQTAAYIYHRGGILRFGKLTMTDADLEILGDRPGTFNFFQREYNRQLVAGYSKNTLANGLVAHMVDYSRLQSRPADHAHSQISH